MIRINQESNAHPRLVFQIHCNHICKNLIIYRCVISFIYFMCFLGTKIIHVK